LQEHRDLHACPIDAGCGCGRCAPAVHNNRQRRMQLVSEVPSMSEKPQLTLAWGISGGTIFDGETSKVALDLTTLICGPESGAEEGQRVNRNYAVRFVSNSSPRFQVSVIHLDDLIFFNEPGEEDRVGFYEGPNGYNYERALASLKAELADQSVLLVIIEGHRAFWDERIVELLHLLAWLPITRETTRWLCGGSALFNEKVAHFDNHVWPNHERYDISVFERFRHLIHNLPEVGECRWGALLLEEIFELHEWIHDLSRRPEYRSGFELQGGRGGSPHSKRKRLVLRGRTRKQRSRSGSPHKVDESAKLFFLAGPPPVPPTPAALGRPTVPEGHTQHNSIKEEDAYRTALGPALGRPIDCPEGRTQQNSIKEEDAHRTALGPALGRPIDCPAGRTQQNSHEDASVAATCGTSVSRDARSRTASVGRTQQAIQVDSDSDNSTDKPQQRQAAAAEVGPAVASATAAAVVHSAEQGHRAATIGPAMPQGVSMVNLVDSLTNVLTPQERFELKVQQIQQLREENARLRQQIFQGTPWRQVAEGDAKSQPPTPTTVPPDCMQMERNKQEVLRARSQPPPWNTEPQEGCRSKGCNSVKAAAVRPATPVWPPPLGPPPQNAELPLGPPPPNAERLAMAIPPPLQPSVLTSMPTSSLR